MRIFILLFMLAPLFLWGQYPDNPRKLRLGFQTTGAGLTYIKDGAPAHTPGDDEDAWMVLDTANNVLYYWDETAGAWENILDDITQDTVFQITNVPDTTTLAPMQGDAFINSTADTLGLYNGDYWVLFFGGSGGGAVSDTTRFFVYAPAHGLEDSISAYGYVPVKADFTKANSSTLDSTHFAYAVGAPHVDTLELKLSGPLVVTAHGLIVGRLYYLQDDGTQAVTPGTVRAPTVYVLDANTVVLTEVGADQDQVISRQAVPSPVFTFWGGDPQNPSDSIMQIVVDSVFAPAGLAKPSTIFFMSYSSQSKNPTYQDDSPTDSPLNPSHSWFYDGNVVTRMNHLLTSVDLQATSAGLFTLDTVMLVGGIPTDSTVANWLDTNYVQNNLRLPNGAVLYWQGEGNPQSPDYSWMVVDDITNTGESNNYKRILKRLRSPVDSTIYATRTYADSLFIVADSLRAEGDKAAPILVPVFDRHTRLGGCSTAEILYTGFLLIDDQAIDEGAITFEINASPATVTYDVYNADSTSYYFETSASRGAGVYFWEVSYTDSDGNNVGDTNAFDVMAGTPDSVLTVVQDSILVLRVCGVEISRDTISTGGGSGTVTSVALSLPSQFAVTGSPVTSSGTLSGTWNTQAANTVLAGPASGVDAAPTFRSLVAADITAGGGALGTGSAGQVAYWSGTNTITGSANMTYSSPLLTLGGTGASLLLTPTSAPVNAAGKWYTSSTNRPRFMDGTTDWPMVRGAAESFTTGSLLFAGTGGQAQQDNANFFWDDNLNRLAIGTNNTASTIDAKLKIIGSGSLAAGRTGVLIQNTNSSSAAQILLLNSSGNGFSMQASSTGYFGGEAIGIFSIGDIDAVLGTNGGATSGGVAGVIFQLGGYENTPQVYFLPSGTGPNPSALMGINTPTPARTLHVVGEARITDLTTDTPTRIVGADADGDFGEMTAGTGISFAGGQVSATFDISDVGSNLSADDVPVWDGAEFQPSGVTSDGNTISLTADFPFIGNYNGAPGAGEDGYVLRYLDAEGGIVLTESDIPRNFVDNVEVSMNEYNFLMGDVIGIAIDNTSSAEIMVVGASPYSPGSPNPQVIIDASENVVLSGMDNGMVFEAANGIVGYARMGGQGGGASPNVTVFENGLIRMNSPDISFPSAEESTELGPVKVLVLEDSMLFYKDMILDKQSATYYEETERQYTLGTSPSADTVITIDTIGVAFAADSISIADGLITNDRSTTVTWLVHYDFTYNSDEDPCYSFFDLTTDGSEVPAAIAGSSAYSNQVSILGTQHPGRSFLVNVPAGQAIRLCVKGNILAATEMNISYLTITIDEK